MLKDNMILLGKAEDKEIYILPSQMNRHGLIAGASGTGKTVTLKVIAESLSELGVPTFFADVKSDLTGMIVPGDASAIQERLDSMQIKNFQVQSYPVHFFDVYREKGIPMRTSVAAMDPVLLARILELSDAQEGILTIIFKVAEDMKLDLIDLKDLQAMTQYVGEHASELTVKYGNVTKQSIGGIQRKLLQLDTEKGNLMFGMPELDLNDLLQVKDGMGVMSILECEQLFQHPMLYSTFLLWLLNKIYEEMPEVGDCDQPKLVFFFDEAHLLFENASKELMDKIIQIVKLVRSKGVGVFFVTQSPTDIPDEVLAQLSNRIQHSLRAYTPAEIKAVKQAADAFRENPALKTADVITSMKTGHALVSCLDKDGAPAIVEETKILPPKSSMQAAPEDARQKAITEDALYNKYKDDIDPDSAYEAMDHIKEDETKAEADALEQKKQEKLQELQEKEQVRKEAHKTDETTRIARKIANRAENEVINLGIRSAKNLLKGLLK